MSVQFLLLAGRGRGEEIVKILGIPYNKEIQEKELTGVARLWLEVRVDGGLDQVGQRVLQVARLPGARPAEQDQGLSPPGEDGPAVDLLDLLQQRVAASVPASALASPSSLIKTWFGLSDGYVNNLQFRELE